MQLVAAVFDVNYYHQSRNICFHHMIHHVTSNELLWFVAKRFLWDTFYLPSFGTCHINDCVCQYNVAPVLELVFLLSNFFSIIRFLIAL